MDKSFSDRERIEIDIKKVQLLALCNSALDSRRRGEAKMDNQSETKKVALEKRERQREARLQRECCQKEKENTKIKYFKCEDRKLLS